MVISSVGTVVTILRDIPEANSEERKLNLQYLEHSEPTSIGIQLRRTSKTKKIFFQNLIYQPKLVGRIADIFIFFLFFTGGIYIPRRQQQRKNKEMSAKRTKTGAPLTKRGARAPETRLEQTGSKSLVY